MLENVKYGLQRLKDIEKEAAEEAKVQQQEEKVPATKEQQQDDQQYDMVAKIKLLYKGKCTTEFRMTGNLNKANIKIIMDNITPHIEMRTKVIYSFKSEIHRGAGKRSWITVRH